MQWRMWSRIGWAEVRRRYRRTVVGPFWSTLSLGFFVLTMGLIYASLWHQEPASYLPFLASGMVCWLLVSSLFNEGCQTFVGNPTLITQSPFNLATLASTVVWRNTIVMLHNLGLFLVIVLLLRATVNANLLLLVPGLLLLMVNGLWICMSLGLICARFRDVQQVVTALLQVALFVTPIFWSPGQLGRQGQFLSAFNPLFHMVEVVRAPLLGENPGLVSYVVMIVMALVGGGLTIVLHRKYRRYIPFWV